VAKPKQSAHKPRFTGVLTEPIQVPNRLMLAPPLAGQALDEAISQCVELQRCERICALAEQLGIELGRHNIGHALYSLVIRLAEELGIEGFKVCRLPKKTRGRTQGTARDDPFLLASEIQNIQQQNPGMSVRAACSLLCKRKPWKELTTLQGRPMNARALEARYNRHLENLANPLWGIHSIEMFRKKNDALDCSHEN
jgi:hypothetical protein